MSYLKKQKSKKYLSDPALLEIFILSTLWQEPPWSSNGLRLCAFTAEGMGLGLIAGQGTKIQDLTCHMAWATPQKKQHFRTILTNEVFFELIISRGPLWKTTWSSENVPNILPN